MTGLCGWSAARYESVMRCDGHLSVARAEVRGHDVTRHAGSSFQSGRAWAISAGLGPPRLWAYATGAALEGFGEGLETASGSGGARADVALAAARARLAERCDALIERMIPDATLIGLVLEHGDLHVVSCGPGRVYLHRGGQARRLTMRDDMPDGLLRASPTRASTPLEPGDLVLAGSSSAFSQAAITKVSMVLEQDRTTPPSVIATLLTEPASQAGVGAAALVLRVR